MEMTPDSVRVSRRVNEEAAREEAQRLEAQNPLWIVVFGVYTKEFVCFPRFTVPGDAIVAARYPDALPSRMRSIEKAAPDAAAALTEG
jgi:hypothetical protein